VKRTPLTRKAPLQRSARLRPANTRRRRARYERAFGERGELVRRMPCLLAHLTVCDGRVVAAHVRSRGAGHRLDLTAEAARVAADLDDRGVL
jgi:hypothetical protein